MICFKLSSKIDCFTSEVYKQSVHILKSVTFCECPFCKFVKVLIFDAKYFSSEFVS